MKIRTDFVTNSSSSCFVIRNKTDIDKTLEDFVKDFMPLLQEFKSLVGENSFWFGLCLEDILLDQTIEYSDCVQFYNKDSNEEEDQIFPAHQDIELYCDIDGNGGNLLSHVLGYKLKEGMSTESFEVVKYGRDGIDYYY